MSFRTDIADFLGPEIIARDVEYKGKTRTFHFKDIGGDDAEKLFATRLGDKSKGGFRSRVIAKVVCLDDGRPAFTLEEAASLPNEFQNVLVNQHCFPVLGIKTEGEKGDAPAVDPEEEAGNVPSA